MQRGLVHCLAERGVRVDRALQVLGAGGVLEREHRLGSGQQAGLLCRAGDSGIPQSCRDGDADCGL